MTWVRHLLQAVVVDLDSNLGGFDLENNIIKKINSESSNIKAQHNLSMHLLVYVHLILLRHLHWQEVTGPYQKKIFWKNKMSTSFSSISQGILSPLVIRCYYFLLWTIKWLLKDKISHQLMPNIIFLLGSKMPSFFAVCTCRISYCRD